MTDYNNIDWNQYLEYSEDSPSGLVWKVSKGTVSGSKSAGSNNKNYWMVGFNRKQFSVHRIVWVMHYGSIDPSDEIDHIDGNPSNNKIYNLRLVDRTTNNRNKRKHSNNTTGVTGVQFKYKRKKPYYECSFYDGKQRKFKIFSINKYGHDKAFELACQWREDKMAELDDYTERHGK